MPYPRTCGGGHFVCKADSGRLVHRRPCPSLKPTYRRSGMGQLRSYRCSVTMRLMQAAAPTLVDLRERPELAPAVADRVWRAWWKPKGYSLAFIHGLVQHNLSDAPLPFALVAHSASLFLGTASVIESDLDARPQYTPWVAAVWVEPDHRSKGVGSALVRACIAKALANGFDAPYLCARPSMRAFYSRLDLRLIETGVGETLLDVYRSAQRPSV